MANIFSLVGESLPSGTYVVGFRGTEAISQLYRFEIGLLVRGEPLDLGAVVGSRGTLTIDCGPNAWPQPFHGILARVELLHQSGDDILYRALLVPRLWWATRTQHTRVFVNKRTPEIVRSVVGPPDGVLGDDFDLRLGEENYPKHEYVCQYRESDFAFVSRWLAREGMYFFFDHPLPPPPRPGGGPVPIGRAMLVITDSRLLHCELSNPAVRYVPGSGSDAMALEALDSFRSERSALPAAVELADYNYLTPDLPLVRGALVGPGGLGVVRSFGDNLPDEHEAERRARLRAEQLRAREQVAYGHGRIFHLRPGFRFKLTDHPNSQLAGEYLVTELRHYGNQSGGDARFKQLLGLDSDDEYAVDLEAIPAETQYRAEEGTPWPRIDGYELARICGPAEGEYAQLDEHGRYRVRLLCDESGLPDGEASGLVRMLQPHGGPNAGFHFPLLKGTEVMLLFLGGDPDRPVIAGALPNAVRPSVVTSANRSANVLRTPGHNSLVMEDRRGGQSIDLSCPVQSTYVHLGSPLEGHNLVLNTDNKAHFHFGGEWLVDVDKSSTTNVLENVVFNFYKEYRLNVFESAFVVMRDTIDAWVMKWAKFKFDKEVKLDIGQDLSARVGTIGGGDAKVAVDGQGLVTVASRFDIEVGKDHSVRVGGSYKLGVDGETSAALAGRTDVAVAGRAELIAGAVIVNAHGSGDGGEIKIDAATKLRLGSGAASIWLLGGNIYLDCEELHLSARSRVEIHGGTLINVKSSGPLTVNASEVTLNE